MMEEVVSKPISRRGVSSHDGGGERVSQSGEGVCPLMMEEEVRVSQTAEGGVS